MVVSEEIGSMKATTTAENVAAIADTSTEAAKELAALGDAVLRTALTRAPWLEHERNNGQPLVLLKMESEQVTGSFKVRGALTRGLEAQRAGGKMLIAASTGNHALGVAHAARVLGVHAKLFVPSTAVPCKLRALAKVATEANDLRIVSIDGDCLAAELAARAHAEELEDATYVSPYNDAHVVAGQGTIGVEVAAQLTALGVRVDRPHALYVTVGGGGLTAGVAAYLRARSGRHWRIVGAQPANSAYMQASVRAGRVVDDVHDAPTLSDGSAGAIEHGALTMPLCAALVDEFIAVDEEEIRAAVRDTFHAQNSTIEGAAGVAIAALRKDVAWQRAHPHSVSVVIACGRNIDDETFAGIIEKNDGTDEGG